MIYFAQLALNAPMNIVRPNVPISVVGTLIANQMFDSKENIVIVENVTIGWPRSQMFRHSNYSSALEMAKAIDRWLND